MNPGEECARHEQLLAEERAKSGCYSKNRVAVNAVILVILCVVGAAIAAVVTVLTHHPTKKLSPTLHKEPTVQLPRVNVDSLGALHGYYSPLAGASKVSVFLGIPYAKPPTKDRRWRKPEPFG